MMNTAEVSKKCLQAQPFITASFILLLSFVSAEGTNLGIVGVGE